MKKKIIIITATLACLLVLASVSYISFMKPNGSKITVEKLKDYTAELGTEFSVTSIYSKDENVGDLSEFTVLDPNKNKVQLLNNSLLIRKLGKYSFSYILSMDGTVVKKETTINVSDTTGPSISFRDAQPYAIIGTEYLLPKVIVNDFSGGTIKKIVKLVGNNAEIPVENGKAKIDNYGPYMLSVEATDKFGNKSTKDFQILVKEDGEIESFDYAVNFSTINQYDGIGTIEYNTDKRFIKNGSGSLKLYGRGNADTSYPGFYIPSPAITDLSNYQVFSFWVYNDSNRNINLWFNNVVNDIVLYPKIWNKIEIPKSEFSKYFVNYKNITINAAADKERKGILLFFINGAEDATLYVDSMYAYKKDRSPKIQADLKSGTINVAYTIPTGKVTDDKDKNLTSTIKVFDPNNNLVGLGDGKSFTPKLKGIYAVIYSVTDRDGFEGYAVKQFIVREPIKANEVEAFDDESCIFSVNPSGASATFNKDRNFTKNKSEGSLRILVSKGTQATWPYVTINPKVSDISSKNVISFWMYNNKREDAYVILNKNVIIKVPGNSWKLTELQKGTTDYIAAFPDPSHINLKLDVWNYDYDKYDGANTPLHDREIYIDSIYAYVKSPIPKLTADTVSGTINVPYLIPKAVVTDDEDDNLTATFRVYSPTNMIVNTGIKNTFKPTTRGKYRIIYSAIDSDGNEGYLEKEVIVRDAIKPNEVETFDDEFCMDGISKNGATVTYNTDKKFTKNNSDGSLKISVPKGVSTTWPNVTLTPKVIDISSKNILSFWIYNNKSHDFAIILNKNIIIRVKANSWKRVVLVKGTSDYIAAFPDPTHIKLLFDVWNYDYDKYDGGNTPLYDREIYIDSIYAYNKDPAPAISATVLNGTVNVPFVVPRGVVTDDKDANIVASFKVYNPNNQIISVGKNNQFTPIIRGKYQILYTAMDSDGNQGYCEKEFIVRDAIKPNEVEAFDDKFCMDGISKNVATVTYNTDKKFTKNNSDGSLKISVPKGVSTTWPNVTLTPKVIDISSKNILSFWIYNNKPHDFAVILNKNIIIKVKANSWKRVVLVKGTSDYFAAFPDPTHIQLLFDVWNYDYDKYDGANTPLYDREIYIDSIYAYDKDPAPAISATVSNGTVNVPFLVPSGVVTDDKDTNLGASFKVYNPSNQIISVGKNNQFTPIIRGKYQIVYTAMDSEGNQGYYEKEFIVRDAIKPNEVEAFDDEFCMDGISNNGATVTYNTDKKFTKNNSDGSIKIDVQKGTEATWPFALVKPKVANITGSDIVSFWLYNNTAYDTYVIVNANVIIKVPANSWKYSEFIKGTTDYNALFPTPSEISFKFDIWNYDYDKYYGKSTQLFSREIYVDEIYVSNFVPKNTNEIESFDDSSRLANIYRLGTIFTEFNADPNFTKNNSRGSLKVTVPKGGAQTWQSITLVDPGKTTPKLFNTLAPSKVSFWVYNNKPDAACIIFNEYASSIVIPGNSWKYVEYWWDGSSNSADYWGVFPNPWEAKFKFDVLNFNFGTSDTKLYDRELYIDEIYVSPY